MIHIRRLASTFLPARYEAFHRRWFVRRTVTRAFVNTPVITPVTTFVNTRRLDAAPFLYSQIRDRLLLPGYLRPADGCGLQNRCDRTGRPVCCGLKAMAPGCTLRWCPRPYMECRTTCIQCCEGALASY